MLYGGCGILWAVGGWWMAFGVFLVIWAHHIEKH